MDRQWVRPSETPDVLERVCDAIVETAGRELVMKRWRPRARGRVARIFKPFSNLRIVVREREEVA